MIEQYLSNTNEIATVLILPKILELNEALVEKTRSVVARQPGYSSLRKRSFHTDRENPQISASPIHSGRTAW